MDGLTVIPPRSTCVSEAFVVVVVVFAFVTEVASFTAVVASKSASSSLSRANEVPVVDVAAVVASAVPGNAAADVS